MSQKVKTLKKGSQYIDYLSNDGLSVILLLKLNHLSYAHIRKKYRIINTLIKSATGIINISDNNIENSSITNIIVYMH